MGLYIPGIISNCIRHKAAIEREENMLALYTDIKFVVRFRPVAKMLSESTCRSYIDFLIEAQEMIKSGETQENVYSHFLARLAKMKGGKDGIII